MAKAQDVKLEEPQFDWIQLHNEMDKIEPIETQKDRMFRKIKENPFVPIGFLATAAALCFGLYSFKKGEKKMSQYMMRTRILAQGFTVFALVVGLGMSASKKPTPEPQP